MSANSFDSTWAMLQIDQLCDQFERAWQANSNPRIESFVDDFIRRLPTPPEGDAAGPTDQARQSRLIGDLVEDLVAVEVAYRRRQGARVDSEEYQTRFPNHPEAVTRAFAGLDSKGEDTGNIDSATSIVPLSRNNISGEKPDATPLICTECFRELSPVLGDKDKVVECPGCGKSYAPNADAATTTAAADPPAGIQLPARFQF